MNKLLIRALLTVHVCSSSLSAAPIYFSGNSAAGTFESARASFQAAAGGGLLFEGFNAEFATERSVGFPIGDPFEFTLKEDSKSEHIVSTADPLFVTEGPRGVLVSSNNPSKYIFKFDEPIRAFGIDILNHTTAGTEITFQDDLDNVHVLPDVPASGVDMFFGVMNETPFRKVRFKTWNDGYPKGHFTELMGFDRLEYVARRVSPCLETPEPSSLAMGLLACLTAASWSRQPGFPKRLRRKLPDAPARG